MIFLHILGVILFFGNLIIAFFLMAGIHKQTPLQVVFHSLKLMNLADKWLTTISVILILGSGAAAARMAGISIFGTGWILWSLITFGISGLLFILRVLPLQTRIEKAAEIRLNNKLDDNDQFYQFYLDLRRWKRWAFLASSAAFAAIILMVFKP